MENIQVYINQIVGLVHELADSLVNVTVGVWVKLLVSILRYVRKCKKRIRQTEYLHTISTKGCIHL